MTAAADRDRYEELKGFLTDLMSLVEYLADETHNGNCDTAWISNRVSELQKQVIQATYD
jgi:hypothetical protein